VLNFFKTKAAGLLALKGAIVLAVLYYLVETELVTSDSFTVFYKNPIEMISMACVTFVVLGGLVSLRWKMISNAVGVPADLSLMFQINWISQFFSTFTPGVFGPDGAKTAYLIKSMPGNKKTVIATTIIVDRFVGFYGLALLGSAASGLMLLFRLASDEFQLFAEICVSFTLILTIILILGMFALTPLKRTVSNLNNTTLPTKILAQFIHALEMYKSKKATLLAALAISILVQSGLAMIFFFITVTMFGHSVKGFYFFAIIPIGELSTLVPIGPVGLGIGHLSFEYLFGLIKQSGGAEVFNACTIIRLLIGFLGLIPFLVGIRSSSVKF
jgi:glycosyltransferase 2 family protein